MADEWSFIPNLITAVSGLGGVWLGALLTAKREASREEIRAAKDVSYLAILVVAHLDLVINGCVDVAGDDGSEYGGPSRSDGYYIAIKKRPTFEPLSLDVEWKCLPADLMYKILNLPYSIAVLDRKIDNAIEYDSPPMFDDYFWERQHGYAALGLTVVELAHQLRQQAGLPTHVDGWDRVGYLKDKKQQFEEMREKNRAVVPPPPPAAPDLA